MEVVGVVPRQRSVQERSDPNPLDHLRVFIGTCSRLCDEARASKTRQNIVSNSFLQSVEGPFGFLTGGQGSYLEGAIPLGLRTKQEDTGRELLIILLVSRLLFEPSSQIFQVSDAYFHTGMLSSINPCIRYVKLLVVRLYGHIPVCNCVKVYAVHLTLDMLHGIRHSFMSQDMYFGDWKSVQWGSLDYDLH